MSSRIVAFLALLALYSPLANGAEFLTSSILALVVGDDEYCPSSPANSTCDSFTAPIQLVEYNGLTAAALSVQNMTMPTLSISANDWYLGQMQPCADGSCAVFSAQGTAPYSAVNTGGVRPYISGNRIMVQVKTDGSVDTSTRIDATNYDGIVKGVCAQDSTGFWIAGNVTSKGLIYMATGAVNTHTVVYANADCSGGSCYTGCHARSNTLYMVRTQGQDSFIDTPNPLTGQNLQAAFAVSNNGFVSSTFTYGREIISNAAGNKFWFTEPVIGEIWSGSNPRVIGGMSLLASAVGIRGIALSIDESKLYFCLQKTINWIPANGGTVTVLQTITAPALEYRGLVVPPISCSSLPAGWKCNAAGTAGEPCAAGLSGVNCAFPCSPGYYSLRGSATCTACPIGTYSATSGASSCMDCPAGSYASTTGTPLCTACSPGFWSGATGASSIGSCNACPAGTFSTISGATALNNCTSCAAGSYRATTGGSSCTGCSAGSYGIVVGSNTINDCLSCPVGTFTTSTGASSCTNCGAGTYTNSTGSTACVGCPVGTFSTIIGAISPSNCTDCAAGSYRTTTGGLSCTLCAPGYYGTATGATSSAACLACSPGSYSSSSGASLCTQCPAGTFGSVGLLSTPLCSGRITCPAGTYAVAGATSSDVTLTSVCAPCGGSLTSPLGSISVSACVASTTAAFKTDSILALVVGDNQFCPKAPIANATCNYFTAPIQLVEFNANTANAATVQSIAMPTLSISANDWYLGQMQPCADGSCAVFSAQESAPFSRVNYPGHVNYVGGVLTIPYINGNRVMVRIKSDGTVDTSTKIDDVNYNGIVKGICAQDSTGFWIAGNATGKGIVYMAAGAVNTHTVVYANGACGSGGSCYTGCHSRSNTMYMVRTQSAYAYVDTPNPATGQNLKAAFTVSQNTFFSGSPYYGRELISNAAGTMFWFTEPFLGQIYRGANPGASGGMTLLATATGIRGIALSFDESRLYYCLQKTINWIPAAGGAVTVLQTLASSTLEFRGLVVPPISCTGLPSGWTCNAAGTAGTQCAPGTFGVNCSGICSPGTYSLRGALACTTCPVGVFGATSGLTSPTCSGIVLCPAGKYGLPGANSSDTTSLSVCAPCPANTTSTIGAKNASDCFAARPSTAQMLAFKADSILAMVVGDDVFCPRAPANVTCNYFTAPVRLVEYNSITPSFPALQSLVLPNVSISANDFYLGQMQPCADGSCAVFAAQETPPYTNVLYPGRVGYVGGTLTRPYINGNRIIVQIQPSGIIDFTTKINSATYDGIIKGVCAMDNTGYWIAGNATGNKGIIQMFHGAQNTHTVIHQDAACGTLGSCYTGCHARQDTMYFLRTQAVYAYVDTPSPLYGQNYYAPISVTRNPFFSGSPYYARELISNQQGNLFWFTEPFLGQVYTNANLAANFKVPMAPGMSGGLALLSIVSNTGVTTVGIRGIALSPDETRLYLVTLKTLAWVPSIGGIATTLQTLTQPSLEFRGLVRPPITCFGLPAGYTCNTAGTAGIPCAPGTYGSAAGVCLPCPGGSFGVLAGAPSAAVCQACPPGISCPPGSTVNTIVCPAGSYCLANRGPVACIAGVFCPAGTQFVQNNNAPCPAGMYCPAGAAPVRCPAGTYSSLTGQSSSSVCTNCPAGTYLDTSISASSAVCTNCPFGRYSTTVGAINATFCLECSDAKFCINGAASLDAGGDCPAGWYCGGPGRPTDRCPGGYYSSSTSASLPSTCQPCGAGIFCPPASTNNTVPCESGYECPNLAAPRPCAAGYYQDQTGQSSCKFCANGVIGTQTGAKECKICSAGYYAQTGQLAFDCNPCPANTYSTVSPATSRSVCTACPLSTYSAPGSSSCMSLVWSKLQVGFPLVARSFGAIANNATAMVAVGGRDSSNSLSLISLGIDARNLQIVETPLSSQASNATLDGAANAPHPSDGSTYLFGGANTAGVESNELWLMSASTGGVPSLTTITPSTTTRPSARKLAGMAYLTNCNTIAGACLVLIGGQRGSAILGDVWVFSLTTRVWSQPQSGSAWSILSGAPSARYGHSVVAAPNASMVFVVGGMTATGASNDVFALSPVGFSDVYESEMINLAINKPSFISANDARLGRRGARAANDGNIATFFNQNFNTATGCGTCTDPSSAACTCNMCTLTPIGGAGTTADYGGGQGTNSPWWGIDLGSEQQIDLINLYMRNPQIAGGQYSYDFPMGKSPNPVIYASNSNSTALSTCPNAAPSCPYTSVGASCPPGTTIGPSSGCIPTSFTMPASIVSGGPTRLLSDGLRARYLWLVLPGTPRILSLCEFQVFQKKPWIWRTLSAVTNVALLKKASLSTTLSGWGDGQALRGVDGIASNNMNAPFTFAHTEGNDVPNPWWQVDLGAPKDILYINVFGRGDCCVDRNTGISWTISSGTDYKYGTRCTSAPADITPSANDPKAEISKINFGPLMNGQTAPQYKSFPCKVRGRYVTAWKAPGWTNGAIMLGEVEVFASNFLDVPPGRYGMSSTVHGGCIFLFGGADTNGFKTNELRMFDMLQTKWLPIVTPIGTPPTGRTGGFLSTIVETTLPQPSYYIGLFGGFSNTDQLNDVNLLQLPQCPMYDTTGVSYATDGTGTVCYNFNTVCYVKCSSGATAVNGNTPLVCQMDGKWRGANPPCVFSKPGYPTSVAASTNADGVVTVSWSPPTSVTGGTGGFGTTPFTAYRVKSVASEIYEDWSTTGMFATPITPVEAAPAGSKYLGGNWYKLIEKNGPSVSAFNPPLVSDTSNTWDFFRSTLSGTYYLRLDSDLGKNNWFDQNENMVVYRSWPSTVNQAGSWAIESFVSLDQEVIVSSGNMNPALALIDMSEYFGRGVVEWYSGVRNVGGTNFEIGWESATNTFNYWTNTNTATLGRTYAIYVRIERDATVTPVQFKSYYKLNRGDAWTKFGVTATPSQARNANLDPPNIRPALIARNWAGAARCVGLFSYFRIGSVTCNYAGSQRYVSALTSSALIYGLTRGVSYTFTVEAQTKYGWSRVSDPSTAVTIPFPAAALGAPLVLTSPSQVHIASSVYGAGYESWRAFDGSLPSFWHSDCVDRTTTGGQWLQVDLGSTKEIGAIRFTERQDCCQNRANFFQVWVGDPTTWWDVANQRPTTGYEQCDPSRYNNVISSVAGFAVTFPCFRVGTSVPIKGRYVVVRRAPGSNDLCFHVSELQISSFQSSSSIAQGKVCTMSSLAPPYVCSFALDGSTTTFAQAYTWNAAGWLTVDLGTPTAVKSIGIQARLDSPATANEVASLNGFTIRVGDVSPITAAYNSQNLVCNATFADWLRNNPSSPYNSPSANSGVKTTFDCVANDAWSWRDKIPAVGRFVTMLVPAKVGVSLNVAEIEIIPENLVLVSAGKACALSSIYAPYTCTSAVDGNPTNFAHSNMDLDNFLMIDLGASTAVRLIKIINRQDCCQGRLNGFDFYVGDSPNFRQNQKCDRSVIKPTFDAASGWTSVFQCSLTGRYAIFQVPNSPDSFINVAEIQVFAANYCPQRSAVGATQIGGSVCTGAGYGEVCSFVCLPGWIVVSGGLSATCGGDAWDDAPLVCAPPCPLLAPPTYVEQCHQTFVIEDFNIPGALNRFYSTNPTVERLALPADSPPQGSTWFQLDGYLQASAVLSCNSDMHLVSSSEKLYSNDQGFTISGSIATQTRAGMVFRAFDDANLMRVWFDVNLGYMALERVQNGRVTLIADAFSSIFYSDVFNSMTVSVLNAEVNVTVNGIQYISTSDKTFNFGAAGFYAQTSARFDDFVYSSSCTSCSGMTDGDICTFSCSEGLITVGPVARTCSGTVSLATVAYSPTVEASPMYCTLAAPTFLPATLFVLENSIRNANVGDPLVAYSTSPDFQVQFQILQTYATKAYLNSAYIESLLPDNSLFWVDVCSGQVKVRTGGVDVLNYEGVNTYTITVRAFVSGFTAAESIRNITISVLNIDEKPIVNPVSVTLVENAAWIPGTSASSFVWQNMGGNAVGTIDEWDPENSTVVFAITADSSSGKVSVDNATGLISVSNSFLNTAMNTTESVSFSFETQPNVFTLYVSATQRNNSAFTASSTFIITLLDANDPPLIERNQLLRLLDTDPLTTSAGIVNSYDEDTDIAFNNGTAYSLIAGGSGCGQTSKWPTVDGLSNGTPLFSINSVTGSVTLSQSPTTAWSTITPIIYSGKLTRKVYEICVKTLDVYGGFDQQIVTIAISADTPNLAVIKNQVGLTTSMNTQGGETVTFTGVNFWPTGSAPAYAATYTNGLRTYSATCLFPSNTTITCTTVPGFDSGYIWSITLNPATFGSTPILSEIDLVMSYGAPTVTGISVPSIGGALSQKNLPTTSPVDIVITGYNFGPSNFSGTYFGPATSNPVFYYGNQCANAGGNLVCHEFECLVKTWTHTSITCSSARGVGKDLGWELRVGRLSAMSDTLDQSFLIAYAPPKISKVEGALSTVKVNGLDTFGNELITITGEDFGPDTITWRVGMNSSSRDTVNDPAYLVLPKYGGPTGDLLSFATCSIQTTTTLRCSTVGGVGVNHRVSIIVGGQSQVSLWPSTAGNGNSTSGCTSGLCYLPPILTRIDGAGSRNADTSGGQLVTITGRYFGPKGFTAVYPDAIGTVCYGHAATAPCHYIATNCQVVEETSTISQMNCLTSEGVGKDLQWSVTIGTQLASFAAPLLSSYSAPQVFTFTGAGADKADTLGNQAVTITGKNFGPADLYTNQLLRVIYYTTLTDGGAEFLTEIPSVSYVAFGCSVTTAHIVIECYTIKGAGEALDWQVTVDSQDSKNPTTNYAPPRIDSITYSSNGQAVVAADVNGGEVVSLNGRYFGPVPYGTTTRSLVQLVTYGKVGSEFIATNWTAVSDSQILVTLPPGIGTKLRFMVDVADQFSAPSTGTFSYAIPTITLVSPTSASTFGGATITVDAKNLPLMDGTASFSVLLGQERSKGGYGVYLKLSVPQNDLNAIAARTNPDGSVRGAFQLPTNFAGSNLGVAIAVAQGQASNIVYTTNATGDNSVFSFSDPVINSIVVTRGLFVSANASGDQYLCPAWSSSWSCSSGSSVYQLTINGANFGKDPTKLSATDDPDGVLRTVAVQVGSEWSIASPGAPYDSKDEIFLQEWSHTKIVAFVKQTSGTVRVQLKTQSTYLQPIGANSLQTATLNFANLNPTISNIAGTTTNVPTAGSTTSAVTITVDGLTGATDFKIFVGGNHINGTEAFIECPGNPVVYPCTGLALTGPSGYITTQSASNGGQAVVKFFPPVGQGLNQPVVAVVYAGSSIKPSNQGFTISYASPVITGFQLRVPPATTFSALSAISLGEKIFAGTDGTTKLRIIGSNFGNRPEVTVGDTNIIVPFSAITPCDPVGQVHTCLEFSVPEGEGNGKDAQYTDLNEDRANTPFPKGFTVYSMTPVPIGTSQSSNMVPFSYLPSTVTSVTSLNGLFPTEGGVQLIIVGKNFGAATNPLRTPNPLSVDLTQVGFSSLSCIDVQRQSHSQLTCTLPEGAGSNLGVVATIASVQGNVGSGVWYGLGSPATLTSTQGYDRPSITRAYVIPSSLDTDTISTSTPSDLFALALPKTGTKLNASTAGGDWIILEGINFGEASPSNCAFMAWWYRDSSRLLTCDDMESFQGEGEVSSTNSSIVWGHKLVAFRVIPGLGQKEIALVVRQNTQGLPSQSSNAIRFAYNTPVISTVQIIDGPTGKTTTGVNTEGGDTVTITGLNFGPTTTNTKTSPFNSYTFNGIMLKDAPAVPTAYLVVSFASSCVVLGYNLLGQQITTLLAPTDDGKRFISFDKCSYNGFLEQTDTSVTFYSPSGVGASKPVTVTVVDQTEAIQKSSPPFLLSYKPPSFDRFDPNPIKIDAEPWYTSAKEDGTFSKFAPKVDIYGFQFGNYELADAQQWTPLERSIKLTIAGQECADMVADKTGALMPLRTRKPVDRTGKIDTVITCGIDFRSIPAGVNNVSISIAGQSGYNSAWTPVNKNDFAAPPFGAFIVACERGSYGAVGETCLPCPGNFGAGFIGADCDGFKDFSAFGNLTFNNRFSYPRPRAGYYNLNSSDRNTLKWGSEGESQMPACPDGFQDAKRDVCIVPCDPPESCLANNVCAFGYASKSPLWKCSNCDTGFYRRNIECVKCPDSPWALVIGFTLLVVFAGIVGFVLSQKGVNIAVISIGLDFFQVLAIFASSGVKWPPIVKELLHILSAFNLNIEIVAPECIVPDLSYKAKFWFIMLLPLSVGGLLLGGVFTAISLYKALVLGQRKKADLFAHLPGMINSCLSLLYVLYLYLTRTIFDVFNCTPTFPPDGRLYLTVANHEQCGIPGGTQLTLMPYAVAGLIVYSFGYPAFISSILYKNRELCMLDQLLRAKGTGDDRLTNPNAFELRMTYGRQYFQFKPDQYFWILAVILRKFFISVTAVVFSKNSSFQMAACLLVMFLAYSAQVMVRPYLSAAEFDDVIKAHIESSYTSAIHARLRTQIAKIESRGKKKVRKNLLSFDGTVDRSAILGVLTGWFFNYNTIEQIMIFCAVIVCLMGIMYQANTSSVFYPGALDGVTAVVMITIIFAIFYYFTVVITEMVILYNEDHNRKIAERTKSRKGEDKAKKSQQSGRLVNEDGEINTGRMDAMMNPLFLNQGNSSSSSGSGNGSTIAQMTTLPPIELWHVFRQEYLDMQKALGGGNGGSANSSSPIVDTSDGFSTKISATKKKGFAPVTAGH